MSTEEQSLTQNTTNITDKFFNYKDICFTYINVNNEIFFKGKEIAEYLEYTDTKKALQHNIDNEDKIRLEELIGGQNLTYNEKNTIYISEAGLFSLILGSKKQEAKEFKKSVCKDILPSIRKTGEYKTIKLQLLLDTSFCTSFYAENSIADYLNKNVVYLGIVGLYNNGFLLKYGMSSRVFERDFEEHKKTFGTQFKLLSIIETDNNKEVEDIYEKVIISKGLNVQITFNGKVKKELFITDVNFTIDTAINELEQIVFANPLKAIKDKEQEIKEIQYRLDNNLLLEQEKTKQKEYELELIKEKTKQLELEIRLKELTGNAIKTVTTTMQPIQPIQTYQYYQQYVEVNSNTNNVKKTLESFFTFTGMHNDNIINKDLDILVFNTNIKKTSMIEYIRSIGGVKYHCSSINGHRKVTIRPEIRQQYFSRHIVTI